MLRSWVSFVCGILLASSALIAITAAPGRCAEPGEWVLLDENQDSRFYYDKSASAATQPKEGIVRIRTRVVYTDEGKADAVKILEDAKKFGALFESRYLHELDCKKEKSRLLEVSHLDKNGVTLKTTDLASATEWEEIPPEVRMGLVMEKVCNQAPAKK
jgi:hypothetical protein